LAHDLVSQLQVPAFDNSSMDGYAVRSADVQTPGAELTVTQRIPAGHFGQPLLAGQAARIFTGAPLPPGADAIVMQEQAEAVAEGDATRVRFLAAATPGQWVRYSGEDIRSGDTVLQHLGGARVASRTPAAAVKLEGAEQDVVIILLRGKVPLQILAVAVVLADIHRHQDL